MKVSELLKAINGTLRTNSDIDPNVECALVCDLLSFVMANGANGCAWVTVQTHLNVIAVASLHDMACVIVPEGMKMEEPSVAKANEEGMAVIETPLSAYAVCSIMHDFSIPPSMK